MTVHREAAAPGVLEVLHDLSPVFSGKPYYLAGGTALALLEGHRISADIDLFSPDLDDPGRLLQTIEESVAGLQDSTLGRGTVLFSLSAIQVSIIRYRYPLLLEPTHVVPGILPVAHRDDIAAMKLAAVTARGTRKDFIDLWTLITRHSGLDYYLDAFKRKFSNRDTGHVLRSLTYFADAEDDPPLQLITPIDWPRVKADFRTWVTEILPEYEGGIEAKNDNS